MEINYRKTTTQTDVYSYSCQLAIIHASIICIIGCICVNILYILYDYTTLQKVKGYSNPAGGHLTFISQWILTKCRYNYTVKMNESK